MARKRKTTPARDHGAGRKLTPDDPLYWRMQHEPSGDGSPGLIPFAVSGSKTGSAQINDADGGIGAPRYRAVGVVDNLRAKGLIDDAAASAGNRFRDDFDLSHLDPIRSAPMEPNCGGAGDMSSSQMAARNRVAYAMDAVGGHGSPPGEALWWIVGVGNSLKEYSARQRGSSRAFSIKAGVLIQGALYALAAHYKHHDRFGPPPKKVIKPPPLIRGKAGDD